MDLYFTDKRLEKACNSEKESVKKWGVDNAKKVRTRLTELRAAENLNQISFLPQARLHPLKGDRNGQFAVDVKQPYRLVFKPNHTPVPVKPDGGVDLLKVTDLLILDVEDYHGK
jgi:proteic killer suppression protein